jgi:hypothetical protein
VATTELMELWLPSLLSVVPVVGDTHLPEVRRSGERRFNPTGDKHPPISKELANADQIPY